MKRKVMKGLVAHAALLLCASPIQAQTYNEVNFGGTGVTISYFGPGTTPTNTTLAEGDYILYQDVATIGGDQVDCYVHIEDVTSSVSLTYGDRNASGGSGFSNNAPEYFSPFVSFPSGTSSGPGGSILFTFQFIEDGTFSYNSSTGVGSGTAVTLDSVQINTYDIDGNGQSYSNQANEFGGFTSSNLSSTTNLTATYNSSTGLTQFRSNSNSNTSNATDPDNRVRVNYDSLSNFQIKVSGGGTAYFFLEFAAGHNWPDVVTYYQISGNVYNDSNGLMNNTVDGSGIGALGSSQLYVNLVNSGDSVVQTATVMSDGSYIFTVVAEGTYSLVLTDYQPTQYSTSVSSSIPSTYENTGENQGTGTGNDGTADGELGSIVVSGGNVTDANFGVNAIPIAQDYTEALSGSPVYSQFVTIADPVFSLSNVPSGSDSEDGTLSVGDSIHITSLPDSTNKLFYNGVEVVYGNDGINPPSFSNPFIISSFEPDSMKFQLFCCESVAFDYTVIDAAGAIDQTPATFELTWVGAVPVEFVSINADRTPNNGVVVKWVTASELNNDYFIVERQLNLEAEFKAIAEVLGAGNSNSILEYYYFDEELPKNTTKAYYRIKQVDYNSDFDYSSIASVKFDDPSSVISVHPNPANDVIYVTLGDLSSNGKLEILSMDGKVVKEETLDQLENRILLNDLQPGLYFIKWSTSRTFETLKLRVQ